MREGHWFAYLLELLAASATLLFGFSGALATLPFGFSEASATLPVGFSEASAAPLFDSPWTPVTTTIVFGLLLACLLTTKLLLCLLKAPLWSAQIALLVAVVCAFVLCRDGFLPLATLLIFELACGRGEIRIAAYLSLVATVLLAIIFPQRLSALATTMAVLPVAVFGAYLLAQLAQVRRELTIRDAQLQLSEAKLSSQRGIITTIEAKGRAAERNRLATRIHDQVGHGMTGSILLLEAALLQLKRDPETARASIERATENLRDSVDTIRHELREERVGHVPTGPSQIRAVLDEFEINHPQVTSSLALEGALDQVSQAIWICLHDNLQETLTNVLRHSVATRFTVQISLRKQLLTVDFSDNGSGEQGVAPVRAGQGEASRTRAGQEEERIIKQGMGLAGIEERCAFVGGRVFFAHRAQGFTTRMTFPCKGGKQ
ncbi:MAG: histidine kinase [Coriobacteriales bacterium]|jgi:signal transduction histidine kinase|nr:histidine kinase [Coriobacteriales bacterium]